MKKKDPALKASKRFMLRRNYSDYHYSGRELLRYVLLYFALFGILDYLFYRLPVMMVFSVPFVLIMVKRQKKVLILERRKRINEEFRDALVSMNVAVQAGYSIENAVSAAVRDLKQLYPKGADILEEFEYMERQLFISIPVEELFMDLARRTQVEDIGNFATVYRTARHSGGDMGCLIEQVTRMLSDKIDVQKEIRTALAAKQYEQTIMSLMPAGIIAYMQLSSPGYLDPLYGNALGIVLMTVCLAVYVFAFFLGRKIISIQV